MVCTTKGLTPSRSGRRWTKYTCPLQNRERGSAPRVIPRAARVMWSLSPTAPSPSASANVDFVIRTPSEPSTEVKRAGDPSSSFLSSLLNISWSCSNLSVVVNSASLHVAISLIVGSVGRSHSIPVLKPCEQNTTSIQLPIRE